MSEPRKRRQNAGLRNRAGSGDIPQRGNSSQNNRSKMHLNSGKGYQRQGSYDRVRKIVQEEGRTARNLVQWSVPIESEEKDKDCKERKPLTPYKTAGRSPSNGKSRSRSASERGKPRDSSLVKNDGKGASGGSRPASQNSMGSSKKADLRARYWAFLFDNLARAVDEIYQTCEADESVVECKEVIMMLEQCTKDFKSLIKRLNLLKAYENAEEGHKPLSIAWEVRKSSPGKSLAANQNKEHCVPSPTVSRCLSFAETSRPTSGNSWADKVKGISARIEVPVTDVATINVTSSMDQILGEDHLDLIHSDHAEIMKLMEDDDTEGWETVQGFGRRKYRNQGGPVTPPTPSSISLMIKNAGQKVMALHARNESGDPDAYKSSSNHSMRARTNSRESEKENNPQNQSSPEKESPTSPISVITIMSSSHDKLRDLSPPPMNKLEEVSQISSNRKDVKYESERRRNRELWLTPQTNRAHDIFSSDDEKDDETEDEDLARRLDEELVSALTEEEKLVKELEQEQQWALESAIKEEQSYLQEIEREEQRQVEVETEPETEHSENEFSSALDSSFSLSAQTLDWDTMIKEYDERQKRSWAELADEADTRTPGRVVIMHEKLSSPSRKRFTDRSPTESWKRHEEKQQKAQELREKLLHEKADRLSTLTKKVEEVRALKEELLSQRRDTIQQKMHRAEEKRQLQLKQKVRKAKDEEAKAMEIAFINTLEAQNKRHDINVKHQESEARLHEIVEERHRKHEEKAAKEAAVEERRKALEAERQARLLEMQEKRKQRESEFEQRQLEREKERIEAARTKECEREERIAALNAQQVAHIQELQRKIQQKQDESARRHKENLDQIREKAFEMSVRQFSAEDHSQVPKIQPYDQKKFCTVCNRLIPSEVYLSSHLQGKKHRQALKESNGGKELSKQEIEAFNVKHIADAPAEKSEHQNTTDKERQKALKKRCKKLRTRMVQRGGEYEATLSGKQSSVVDSQHRAKLQKVVKDLQKYVNSHEKGPWPQNKVSALDRALGEVARILDKRVPVSADQLTLRACGGLSVILSILDTASNSNSDLPPIIPPKSLVHACTVLRLACKGCYDNCHYMLFSNKIGQLIDLLSNQLNVLIPENLNVLLSSSGGNGILQLPYDPVTPALMHLIATVLQCLAKNNPTMSCSEAAAERMSASGDPYMSRANDVVSYSVSCGVIDKLHIYFNSVRGPIDQDTRAIDFLQHSLGLLTAIAKLLCRKNVGVFDQNKAEDTTQLITTLRVTDLVGIVSLMYGMLLHCDAPTRGEATPPDLPAHTILVTTMALRLLNHIAVLDINMLQSTLGGEGTWLEFRHITSHLLWYCQHCSHEELLHEVVLCIGYFCILNMDNQNMMHSGQAPTVLQQLCSLPFQYFSHPRLTSILFPSLIACCFNNRANCQVLEQDLSAQLLSNFVEEKLLEGQQATMTTASNKKSPKGQDKESERMSFAVRLPPEEWKKAQDFFQSLGTIPS